MTRLLLAASLVLALTPGRGVAFLRSESASGACLAWPQRRIEFTADADGLAGQQPVCSPGGPLDRLAAALGAWSQAARAGSPPCTDLQFALTASTSGTEIGTSGSAADDNLVVWRRGACGTLDSVEDPCWAPDARISCAAKYNCWEYGDEGTIALTTTSYLVSSGQIVDADIELRAWDGSPGAYAVGESGWYFTCFDPASPTAPACTAYGQPDCVGIDLEGVLAHELGHAIGIADQYTISSGTMYGYAEIGEVLKRTLAPDDVDAVCAIYPAGASTPSCGARSAFVGAALAGSGSGSGCATAGVPGIAAIAGALVALRRRRRS